jgi:hypothetical protein
MSSFRLAPMSSAIRALTMFLFLLPLAFFAIGASGESPLRFPPALGRSLFFYPAVFVSVIYAWVWLRFRPLRFVVHPESLEIVWPLKRRRIARAEISGARILDAKQMRGEIGWGMRVGAGGLWGGFGWLWTGRRGIVQMYISRTDRFVWVERGGERPWLITPERPEEFVRVLSAPGVGSVRH